MSEYVSFEGCIEPLEWGKSIYTILRIPSDIAAQLDAQGAKRVEGEINDHPVNLALTKAPVVDGLFLWAGKTLLRKVGVEPGERLFVRLRKADPNEVDVPTDVLNAIRSGEVTAQWNALTPGKQRSFLYPISTAKRAETRAKRLNALVNELRDQT